MPKAGYNEQFGVDTNNRLKLRDLVTVYENANGVKLNIKWGERAYRERSNAAMSEFKKHS